MADQDENKLRLEKQTALYIRLRYPLAHEIDLMPKSGGQVSTFNSWRDWISDVMQELVTAQAAVDAGPNEAAWDAVELDTATLDTADPMLILRDFVKL